ncbi:hypothetical protein [Nonlabens sp. Asnod3-A02]|uniref:hypothetical protein n=1 Tax=Nonlabens sp. Asnod3-A02 TaxID=3160579 RepID=UPI003866626B
MKHFNHCNRFIFIFINLVVVLISTVHAQSYKKTYNQNINHNVRNQNGKNLTLNFAVQYDAFFGEPLIKSRTKITNEGNFIIYNGKKYTREQIGDKAFDNVEIGLVNVAFDIYQGSIKVTTVQLDNELSVSFIAGSPDWDELWPGVSEERAKQIWKEGYTIRNARLYNVKFNGFYGIESYLKNIEQEKVKQQQAKERKELEEKRKKEQEAEKVKQEKATASQNQTKASDNTSIAYSNTKPSNNSSNSYNSQSSNSNAQSSYRTAVQEQQLAYKRKQEAYAEKQKREQERQIAELNKKIKENQKNYERLTVASNQASNELSQGNYMKAGVTMATEYAKQGNKTGAYVSLAAGTIGELIKVNAENKRRREAEEQRQRELERKRLEEKRKLEEIERKKIAEEKLLRRTFNMLANRIRNDKEGIIRKRVNAIKNEKNMEPTYSLQTNDPIYFHYVLIDKNYDDISERLVYPRTIDIKINTEPKIYVSPVIAIHPNVRGEFKYIKDIKKELEESFSKDPTKIFQLRGWSFNQEEINQNIKTLSDKAINAGFQINYDELGLVDYEEKNTESVLKSNYWNTQVPTKKDTLNPSIEIKNNKPNYWKNNN